MSQASVKLALQALAGLPTSTPAEVAAAQNAFAAVIFDAAWYAYATPGAHGSSHEAGGDDALTLAQAQVTNLTTDLAAKFPYAGGTLTGAVVLAQSTGLAGTAPLYIPSGPLLIAAEAGALERLVDKLYFTDSTATRRPVTLWDSSGTAGCVPFVTTDGRLLTASNFTRDPTTGAITLGGGANLVMTGATTLGTGNIIMSAAATNLFDTNLILCDATNRTMGFICGATPGFAGAYGPFFGLRGITYSAAANQRGNMFFYGGKPAAPGALEGRVIFGTNDTERLEVTYGGDVKVKTGTLYVNQGVLVLPKTKNYGIMVDTTTPTYAWQVILGPIEVRGVGANDPDWAVFRDTIRQYRWTNGNMREVWLLQHIPHDYCMGTDMYASIHWDQNVVDTGGPAGVPGNVKWYLDITYAKGHGTPGGTADPFNAIVTASVVQQASTTQYGHMEAEVAITSAGGSASTIDRARLEPGGIMKIRLYRDSGDVADTLNQDPFVGMCDLMYQSTNVGTKQRSGPNFWT